MKFSCYFFDFLTNYFVFLTQIIRAVMAPIVEVVADRVTLGEGPHWDVKSQSLYYVDILGQAIHKYTPSENKHTKANIGKLHFKLYFFTPL